VAEELSYKTMKRLNSASIKAKKKIILLTVSAAEYGQTETLKFLIYNVGMSLLVEALAAAAQNGQLETV
jgi:hypothetical protein